MSDILNEYLAYLNEENIVNELVPQMIAYSIQQKDKIRECIAKCKRENNDSLFCKSKCYVPKND